MKAHNLPKKALRKPLNRVLAPLVNRLSSIEHQLKEISERQASQSAETRELLQGAQRDIVARVQNKGFVKISENEILAKIFSGAKVYLDPRDIGLVPHLILDGEWEHDVTQAWLSTIMPNDIVLDIGANFGYFGVLAAQQANRNCRTIMFEANPNLIPYLSRTIIVNSFQDCLKVENLAVADKNGKLRLNILKDYIASSSLHGVEQLNKYNQNGDTFHLSSSVEVSAIAIDTYCQKNKIHEVNVIKMDIEGYEDKAYAGMREIVKKSPDITLFIEFTRQAYSDPESFYGDMLEDFGNVYVISQDGHINKLKDNNYKKVFGDTQHWKMLVFSKKRIG